MLLTLDLVAGGRPPDPTAGRQVNFWCDDTGEICARLFTNGTARWVDWPRLGVFSFEPGSQSVQGFPAPGVRPEVVAETFARVLRPAILQALGSQALHASGVVGPEGVLAFCGPAMSGKSTLAYALQQAGLPEFADDTLVVSLAGGGVIAQALPFTPRLRPLSRSHFNAAARRGARALNVATSTHPAPSACPLAAIFVLTRDEMAGDSPTLGSVPPARAFSELLNHALCFDQTDPAEVARIVGDYLEIAKRVPVFALTYRPGFERLRALVDVVMNAPSVGAAYRHMVVR
jgi:hypothetical protein